MGHTHIAATEVSRSTIDTVVCRKACRCVTVLTCMSIGQRLSEEQIVIGPERSKLVHRSRSFGNGSHAHIFLLWYLTCCIDEVDISITVFHIIEATILRFVDSITGGRWIIARAKRLVVSLLQIVVGSILIPCP